MKIPTPRQLPSGSWNIQMMVKGQRISKTFASKEEAFLYVKSQKEAQKAARQNVLQSEYDRIVQHLLNDDSFNSNSNMRVQLPTIVGELSRIDKMTGRKFEEYCRFLLLATGCFYGADISVTQASSDYGADLVITCINGQRVVIQCKRLAGNVKIDAVQEVYTSRLHYNAIHAAVITNSHFTKQAKQLAKDTGVTLIDRKGLTKIVQMYLNELNKSSNSSQWNEFLKEIPCL